MRVNLPRFAFPMTASEMFSASTLATIFLTTSAATLPYSRTNFSNWLPLRVMSETTAYVEIPRASRGSWVIQMPVKQAEISSWRRGAIAGA